MHWHPLLFCLAVCWCFRSLPYIFKVVHYFILRYLFIAPLCFFSRFKSQWEFLLVNLFSLLVSKNTSVVVFSVQFDYLWFYAGFYMYIDNRSYYYWRLIWWKTLSWFRLSYFYVPTCIRIIDICLHLKTNIMDPLFPVHSNWGGRLCSSMWNVYSVVNFTLKPL